jgi:hypothetical protein
MAVAEGLRPGARTEFVRRALGSPTLRLAGRRALAAIPVLWGVTFLTYVVMDLLPGDTAQILLGANATPAEIHQLSVELHLNEPFWVRYGIWLGDMFHGSLGTSLQSGENVTTILGARLPVTAELLLYAFVVSLVLAVGLAVLVARWPNGMLGVGVIIILEGALSYLGLGIPLPEASWGSMIAQGQQSLTATPDLVLIPSAFLFATVASLNLVGDALRERWGVR